MLPARAIDRNMSGHPAMKSVARTKTETDPWLKVTFHQPLKLLDLEILAGMQNFPLFAKEGLFEGLRRSLALHFPYP